MILSNYYLIKKLGKHLVKIPSDKKECNDDIIENISLKVGKHQVFLDISRCPNLSNSIIPIIIQLYDSILYLDISFTKINDLTSIINNCNLLKSLNIAGLKITSSDNYNSLENLLYLELLNLRSSNVSNLLFLRNSYCLRSLDIGCTEIISDGIEIVLNNCTRLEELRLDGCRHYDLTTTTTTIDYLKDILQKNISLTVININDSNIELPSPFPSKCIFENCSRRFYLNNIILL